MARGIRRFARSRRSPILRIIRVATGFTALHRACAHYRLKMLDCRRRFEKRTDVSTPLRECGRTAKTYRVILERLPLHDQRIAVGSLHRAPQLVRQISLAAAENLDGGRKDRLELLLTSRSNSQLRKFNDHVDAPCFT